LNESLHKNGGKDIDLLQWTDDWLKTAGPNTLKVEIVMGDDGAPKVNIVQGNSKYGDKIFRQQRIDVAIYTDNNPPIELKGIMIEKSAETKDILTQVSAEQKDEAEKLIKAWKANPKNSKLGCLANANNRGYCRVIFTESDIDYFSHHIMQLPTINRCYAWRILFDQVKVGSMSPAEYLSLVAVVLKDEEKEAPTILENVCFIADNCLISDTEKPNDIASRLGVIASVIEFKMSQNMNDSSMINELLGYFIRFCSNNEQLLYMAEHSSFPDKP
jgi:hypothetical protein